MRKLLIKNTNRMGEKELADRNNRFPENAEGSYYVDEKCISCGLCVATAPYNFKFTVGDKNGIHFIMLRKKRRDYLMFIEF